MKKNTEVTTTLTTQQLEQSGIKTSLNQNDVVEIIATEAFDKIINSLNNAEQFEDKDDVLINDLKEDFKNEIIKSKVLTKPFDDYNISIELQSLHNITFTRLYLEIEEDRTDGFIVKLVSPKFNKSFTDIINCKYSETIDSVTLDNQGAFNKIHTDYYRKTFYKEYNYKSIYTPKQYQKKVDEYNKYIKDFYDSIPIIEKTGVRHGVHKAISYNILAKQARVNVNRSIIKNQAPEVSVQLNKLFGITI